MSKSIEQLLSDNQVISVQGKTDALTLMGLNPDSIILVQRVERGTFLRYGDYARIVPSNHFGTLRIDDNIIPPNQWFSLYEHSYAKFDLEGDVKIEFALVPPSIKLKS